jgi:hypothetical protein
VGVVQSAYGCVPSTALGRVKGKSMTTVDSLSDPANTIGS